MSIIKLDSIAGDLESVLIDPEEYKVMYNKLSKETRNDLASFYGREFDDGFEEGELIEGYLDNAVKYYKYSDSPIASQNLVDRSKFYIVGLMIMIITLVGGSCNHPFLNSVPFTDDSIKLLWRNQALFLIVLPCGIVEYIHNRPIIGLYKIIRFETAAFLLKAGIGMSKEFTFIKGQTLWLLLLFIPSRMTHASHAYIFNGLCSIEIIAYRLMQYHTIHKLEGVGTLITLLCAVVALFLDPTVDFTGKFSIWGDILAIAGSLCGTLFFLTSAKAVKRIPQFIFLTGLVLTNIIFTFILAKIVSDVQFFSFDKKIGFFGWMNSVDIFIYILIFAGLIAGFMTNCGYVMCLKYYSPLVVSNLILFEPIGGHILEATILGKSKIGFVTLLSAIIMLVGIYFVSKGSRLKKKMQK